MKAALPLLCLALLTGCSKQPDDGNSDAAIANAAAALDAAANASVASAIQDLEAQANAALAVPANDDADNDSVSANSQEAKDEP